MSPSRPRFIWFVIAQIYGVIIHRGQNRAVPLQTLFDSLFWSPEIFVEVRICGASLAWATDGEMLNKFMILHVNLAYATIFIYRLIMISSRGNWPILFICALKVFFIVYMVSRRFFTPGPRPFKKSCGLHLLLYFLIIIMPCIVIIKFTVI